MLFDQVKNQFLQFNVLESKVNMTRKEKLEKKKAFFSLKKYLQQQAVKRASKLQHRDDKRKTKKETE